MAEALQTALASAFKNRFFCYSLWSQVESVSAIIFVIPKLFIKKQTIFVYYAGHLSENWMVHTKLHFYVNIFHVWSGLGGMKFVWPKECSMQSNSLDSSWLLHPCSVVSMPCALDQAAVVHDPLHGWVSCFTVAFNDGKRCVCLRFWERIIGYTVLEVDGRGRSVMMWVSIYPPQC